MRVTAGRRGAQPAVGCRAVNTVALNTQTHAPWPAHYLQSHRLPAVYLQRSHFHKLLFFFCSFFFASKDVQVQLENASHVTSEQWNESFEGKRRRGQRWQGGQLTAKEIFTVGETRARRLCFSRPGLMSVEGVPSPRRT